MTFNKEVWSGELLEQPSGREGMTSLHFQKCTEYVLILLRNIM